MSENQTILLLIDDLFFSVKVEEVAKRQGYAVNTVSDAAAFLRALSEERPAMAVLSLAAHGIDAATVIHEASCIGVPVLAFGPHVDKEAHQVARDAGARMSITNSQLMRELPALIQELAGPPANKSAGY
ncbi:MAG: hypothetical protein ACE5LU_23045 [Anaerolineae bacterium]